MKQWVLEKRWRIILSGILITAGPLVSLAAFTIYSVSVALEERLIKESGWFSANATAAIEEKLRGDITLGKLFVTRPLLLAALKKRDKNEMSSHLENLVDIVPLLDRAFITTPKGIQLACYPETPETIGRDFSDRDWYRGVSKNWTPYISEFYLRAANPQRHLFAIAVPIRWQGAVEGILVMQPKSEYLKDISSGIDIGIGRIQVVDKKGHLLYHSSYTVDGIIDYSGVSTVRKVMREEEGVDKIVDPEDKKPVFSAYHPIKELGWGVIVDKPVEVVLAPVRRITLVIFTITGFILLLGGFFSYRFSEMLIAQKALSEERNRIFNCSLDMLCIAGFDGYFKQLNPAWEKTLGWTNEELLSKPFLEFVHPEDRETTIQAAGSLSEGKTVLPFDNRYLCKNGSYKWLSWNSYPIIEEKVIFAVARDITERKLVEENIKRLNEDLQRSVRDLDAANKELESFSYSVSHDLRAPLRHLTGFVELLNKRAPETLDEKSKHYLNVISDSAQQMGTLVDDLLAFSRMGRVEMTKKKVSLDQIVREALRELQTEMKDRNIVWKIDPLPEAYGDPSMLRLVFVNLVNNAIKFTSRQPQPEIEIGCNTGNPEEAVFFVRDNGVGFDMRYVDKLFCLFQRLHRQEEFEGTGLGLANVQRIIHRHGGRTWAESFPDGGATFYFSLPKQTAISGQQLADS